MAINGLRGLAGRISCWRRCTGPGTASGSKEERSACMDAWALLARKLKRSRAWVFMAGYVNACISVQ